MKKCTTCNLTKSDDDFYDHSSKCKSCCSIEYQANKKKLNKDRSEYHKQYSKDHPEVKESSRLKKLYGITLEQYQEMYNSQNGLCAMCGKPETISLNGKSTKLSVDHDHETGEIRGLLCRACNALLGLANDSLEVLKNGIVYIESYKR